MQDVKFNKFLISLNALIPLAFLLFDWYRGGLGANPIEFFLRTTGVLALIFVLVSLLITPLRKLFGWLMNAVSTFIHPLSSVTVTK